MQHKLKNISLPLLNLVAIIALILLISFDLRLTRNPTITCLDKDYGCYALAARYNRDVESCRKIPMNDEIYRKGRWDDELNILNKDVRARCLYNLAISTGDIKLCKELDSSLYGKEDCIYEVTKKRLGVPLS